MLPTGAEQARQLLVAAMVRQCRDRVPGRTAFDHALELPSGFSSRRQEHPERAVMQFDDAIFCWFGHGAALEVAAPPPAHLSVVVGDRFGVRCGDDRVVDDDHQRSVRTNGGGNLLEERDVIREEVEQADSDSLVDRAGLFSDVCSAGE